MRTAPVVAEPFTNPPGYNSIGANMAILKGGPRAQRFVTDRHGNPIDHRTASVQQFMDTETVFAGTPDDVFDQIKAFNDRMGGVGHLLFFGQGGFLDHADTVDNISLFGQGGGAAAARAEPGAGETRRHRRGAIGSADADPSPADRPGPRGDGQGQLRPIEAMTPAEARAQMEATARARKAEPLPVARVEERQIPGPAGDMRLRLYWPERRGAGAGDRLLPWRRPRHRQPRHATI